MNTTACGCCVQQSSVLKVSTEGEEYASVHAEDMQYNDAKSYVMLEICLRQPLVRKRDTEELAKRY